MDWLLYDFLSDLPSDLASGVRLGLVFSFVVGGVLACFRVVCAALHIEPGSGTAENP